MNSKKKLRIIIRKTLSEVMTFAGGSAWDSNNDISSFHGYPSGYSEFPYLRTDTPDMLPDSEEVNCENDSNTDIINSKEFKDILGIEIKKHKKNNEFIDIHAITKRILQQL
jgi:hypothetical protein